MEIQPILVLQPEKWGHQTRQASLGMETLFPFPAETRLFGVIRIPANFGTGNYLLILDEGALNHSHHFIFVFSLW